MNLFGKAVAACVLAAGSIAHAADMPDVTMQGVASGSSLKVGFEGHGARVLPETVYLHDDRMRLEFQSARQQGYLLRDGKAVWLIDDKDKRAWPLQYSNSARQFVFDPTRPCSTSAFSCERDGTRTIAGRAATGWRFRHAGTHGPDGSDNGTLWIDDQYGLLLGYHAEDMNSQSMDWTATSVSFDPLPKELFQLPDGSDPSGKPPNPGAGATPDAR